MSLNQAIKHRKEHRREYRGSARFARSCRPHGECEWCRKNRLANTLRKLQLLKDE